MLIPLFLFRSEPARHDLRDDAYDDGISDRQPRHIVGVLIAVALLAQGTRARSRTDRSRMREAGIAGLFASTYMVPGQLRRAARSRAAEDASFFSAGSNRQPV